MVFVSLFRAFFFVFELTHGKKTFSDGKHNNSCNDNSGTKQVVLKKMGQYQSLDTLRNLAHF